LNKKFDFPQYIVVYLVYQLKISGDPQLWLHAYSLKRARLQDILKDSHSFGLLPNTPISEICHLPDMISEAGHLDPFFPGFPPGTDF
jgi:hypothetical protein